MKTVTVAEATNDLARLRADVERGEEITIAREGKPVACLHGVSAPIPLTPRRLGLLARLGWIAQDFNESKAPAEVADWEDAPLTSST